MTTRVRPRLRRPAVAVAGVGRSPIDRTAADRLRLESVLVTTPQPRAALAKVPPYVPGKPPTARVGPGSELPTYKLSSNENPYPPLPGVLAEAVRAAETMNRYPDMGITALYEALAQHLGVTSDRLAAGTGSVALLYHLIQAYCGPDDEVLYAWRSFEAYPIATAVAGATAVQVPLREDGEHDFPAMLAAITERTKVVLVCTPNNPTGPAVTASALRDFVSRVPSQVIVVVDEAYREFVRIEDRADAVALLADFGNVVAMRTFAKAYGLAGLRCGYLVAAPPVVAAVRACSLPFGVSSIAQAAAVASLAREAELSERVEALVAERSRVIAALREQGLKLPDAQGNFVWLPLGARTADFVAAAEAAGIMVRPFTGEGVRISIGEVAGNDVFLRVAAEFAR
ncbi:MAG: histidinol-phosphate transaminase [Nocardioidaceae bacterium]|nr:MAG: histidinol-phosphate transaminase [Nocardioidaceae bacterium]